MIKIKGPPHFHQGSFILAAREGIWCNQANLARALGITPQFMGKIEKGFAPLPEYLIGKLLEFTGSDLKAFAMACANDTWHKKFTAVNS